MAELNYATESLSDQEEAIAQRILTALITSGAQLPDLTQSTAKTALDALVADNLVNREPLSITPLGYDVSVTADIDRSTGGSGKISAALTDIGDNNAAIAATNTRADAEEERLVASLSYGMFDDFARTSQCSMLSQHDNTQAIALLKELATGAKSISELAQTHGSAEALGSLLFPLDIDHLTHMYLFENDRVAAITPLGKEVLDAVIARETAGEANVRLETFTSPVCADGSMYDKRTAVKLLEGQENRIAVEVLKRLGDEPLEMRELNPLRIGSKPDYLTAVIHLDSDALVQLCEENGKISVRPTNAGKAVQAKIIELEGAGVTDIDLGKLVERMKQTGALAATWADYAKETTGSMREVG